MIEFDEKIRKNSNDFFSLKTAKAGFKKGLIFGLMNSAFEAWFNLPLIRKVEYKKDSLAIEKANLHKEIKYPKHDGKITFDILESVSRSDTFHDHNTPSHLVVKNN